MKNRLLIILVLFSIQYSVSGQTRETVDSLHHTIRNFLKDIDPANASKAMNELGYTHRLLNNFDSASYWFYESQELAEKHDLTWQLAYNCIDLAWVTYSKGDMDSTIAFYEYALELHHQLDDKEGIGQDHLDLSGIYTQMGDFALALKSMQLSLEAFTSLKDSFQIAEVYSNFGNLYSMQGELKKATEYLTKAQVIQEKLKLEEPLSRNFFALGVISNKKGAFKEALSYYRRGIAIQENLNLDSRMRSALYSNIGNAQERLGNLDSAYYYQQKALQQSEKINSTIGKGWVFNSLASIHFRKGEYTEAIEFGRKSYEIGIQSDEFEIMKQSSQMLSKTYAAVGDYENAYQSHIQFKAANDSLYNAKSVRQLVTQAFEYEQEQKDKIKEANYQAGIKEQKIITRGAFIGLVMLFLFLLIVYRSNLRKKRTNKLLTTQKEELALLNTTKDRFFGIIAHDLRGPVTALQGITKMLDYLIKKGDQDGLSKVTAQIEESSIKVNDLLDNLLKWALSQQKTMPYKPQSISLKQIIEENIGYFEQMATSKNISLYSDISEDVHIHADKESISTVFRNLINNGLKFTPPGGSVSLSATTKEKEVQIDVKDNGVGIREEKLKNLFTLNDEKSTPGTNDEKGTGLGLQLVKDFVNMNHGTISIKSKLNTGSVFSIVFPSHLSMAS